MGDAAFDPVAIAADAVLLAELHGGPGHKQVRIDWLCGPGIGDNAIAVATAVAVCERVLPEPTPIAIVFTVGEEGLGGLRGARHACRELASEAVLALEGHGSDRVFTTAVGSLRVRFTVTGPGGHSWWNRGRPSAVHELVRLLDGMIAAASAQLPVNVGLIEGGTGVNAIAARASATVEWRATDQDLLDRQAAAVAGLEASPGLRLSVQQLDRRPAGFIPLTHPAGRRGPAGPALDRPERYDRRRLHRRQRGARRRHTAPALGCGEDMHAPTERIRADSIAVGARQLRAVLAEVLDSPRDPRRTDPADRKPTRNRGNESAPNRQGLHRVAPRRPGGVDRR